MIRPDESAERRRRWPEMGSAGPPPTSAYRRCLGEVFALGWFSPWFFFGFGFFEILFLNFERVMEGINK